MKQANEPGVTPSSRALHVLVVDDDPLVRDILAQFLILDGHTVETAANGMEGLERFHASSFDVVITDNAMPEMNGAELAAAIKRTDPNKPIIMVTGLGSRMKAAGDVPEGVDLLLSKPVTLGMLREALGSLFPGIVNGGSNSS